MITVKDSEKFIVSVMDNELILKVTNFPIIYLYINFKSGTSDFKLSYYVKDDKYTSDNDFYGLYYYNGNNLIPINILIKNTLVGKKFIIPIEMPASSDFLKINFEWIGTANDLDIFVTPESIYS